MAADESEPRRTDRLMLPRVEGGPLNHHCSPSRPRGERHQHRPLLLIETGTRLDLFLTQVKTNHRPDQDEGRGAQGTTRKPATSLRRFIHLEVVIAEQVDELYHHLLDLRQVCTTHRAQTRHVPCVDERAQLIDLKRC